MVWETKIAGVGDFLIIANGIRVALICKDKHNLHLIYNDDGERELTGLKYDENGYIELDK